MSHLTTAPVRIKDIADLRAAAKHFGGELVEKNTYVWYGRVVYKDTLPPGMKEEDVGKCDYAIKFPGIHYEIGVLRQKDQTFSLVYDFWGKGKEGGYVYVDDRTPGAYHDGELLKEKFGDGLGKFGQRVAAESVLRAARSKGVLCQVKTLSNGSLQLRMAI